MIQINLHTTRTQRLAPPEPLPEIIDEARDAFMGGWVNGIAVGACLGAIGMYFLLVAIGRVVNP
jgi:hypothetical protein